eukprot:3019124-Pleurochrysis_carterae.AAC.1
MFALARAQMAERRRPWRKATHAAVSSESAAREKDVECGTGARKAVQDRGVGRRECSSASRGAALDVEPQSKSKS